MIDIRCPRCGEKLGWRLPDAFGVTIRCIGTRAWSVTAGYVRCGEKITIGRTLTDTRTACNATGGA